MVQRSQDSDSDLSFDSRLRTQNSRLELLFSLIFFPTLPRFSCRLLARAWPKRFARSSRSHPLFQPRRIINASNRATRFAKSNRCLVWASARFVAGLRRGSFWAHRLAKPEITPTTFRR